MLDLPFETTAVIVVGLISLALAIFTLVVLLLNRVRRTIKKMRFQQTPHISVPQHVLRFLMTFIWIALSLAVVFIAAFIQSFNSFTKRELVAEVQCTYVADNERAMLLKLTPIVSGNRQEMQGFILQGDQWALEGNILKWDDWLNFVGLHTQYKLTRVRGRYLDIESEINEKGTVYSLVGKEDTPEWRWLFQHGYRLRFVDAVYGNTVYSYPADHKIYQVFVTTSGFLLKVKEDMSARGTGP